MEDHLSYDSPLDLREKYNKAFKQFKEDMGPLIQNVHVKLATNN